MQTSSLLTKHTLSFALARQREGRIRSRYPAQINRLRAALADNPQRVRSLLNALGGSRRTAHRATTLLRALGASGGAAVAALLPATLAAIEAESPRDAQALRRDDTMLCAAITLVEQLAPERIAEVYWAATRQRGDVGRAPWWTFRAWQHLNEALQRRVMAGDQAAIDAVLETVAAGVSARIGSAAHWRARWAVQHQVAHMAGA